MATRLLRSGKRAKKCRKTLQIRMGLFEHISSCRLRKEHEKSAAACFEQDEWGSSAYGWWWRIGKLSLLVSFLPQRSSSALQFATTTSPQKKQGRARPRFLVNNEMGVRKLLPFPARQAVLAQHEGRSYNAGEVPPRSPSRSAKTVREVMD